MTRYYAVEAAVESASRKIESGSLRAALGLKPERQSMNEITINVAGYNARGKTTVTALIIEALAAVGFDIEVTNVMEAMDLDAIEGRDNEAVAVKLAEHTNIKINTTTLSRAPSTQYFQEV